MVMMMAIDGGDDCDNNCDCDGNDGGDDDGDDDGGGDDDDDRMMMTIKMLMTMLTIRTCGKCHCFTCGAKGIPGNVGGGARYCNQSCQYPPCPDCGQERVKCRVCTQKMKPGWRCPQCTRQAKKSDT